MAKPTFCAFDGSAIAVLMAMTRPCESTSGPPELPGLIAASVWITSPRNPRVARLEVAVQARDDPARHAETSLERERVADRHDVVADLHLVGVAELDGREVRCPRPGCTARSLLGAVPSTLAVSFFPSEKCAWILSAPSTTWLLVTMTPSDDTTKPGPGRAAVARAAVVDDGDDRGNVGLQDGGDVTARFDLVGRSHDHVAGRWRLHGAGAVVVEHRVHPGRDERADDGAHERGHERGATDAAATVCARAGRGASAARHSRARRPGAAEVGRRTAGAPAPDRPVSIDRRGLGCGLARGGIGGRRDDGRLERPRLGRRPARRQQRGLRDLGEPSVWCSGSGSGTVAGSVAGSSGRAGMPLDPPRESGESDTGVLSWISGGDRSSAFTNVAAGRDGSQRATPGAYCSGGQKSVRLRPGNQNPSHGRLVGRLIQLEHWGAGRWTR